MSQKQPREAVTSRNRKVGVKPQNRSFLILCEGKTEKLYFDGLIERHQLNGSEVEANVFLSLEVDGEQGTTTGLVKKAISRHADALEQGAKFDEVWCVFDYDGFDSFDEAVKKCVEWRRQYPYLRVAWSNESFELWFLLHFRYIDTAPGRAKKGKNASGGTVVARQYYIEALEDCFKQEPKLYPESDYSKVAEDVYDLLYPLRGTAIRHARLLLASDVHAGKTKPSEMTPATTVHDLVCILLGSTPDASICRAASVPEPPTLEQLVQWAGLSPDEYSRATRDAENSDAG